MVTCYFGHGDLSLEPPRRVPWRDDHYHPAAKRELSRFKGVGPKTVSCVLMFCLQRAEFPVVRGGGVGIG